MLRHIMTRSKMLTQIAYTTGSFSLNSTKRKAASPSRDNFFVRAPLYTVMAELVSRLVFPILTSQELIFHFAYTMLNRIR